jgi:nicotinamidase-related amidase
LAKATLIGEKDSSMKLGSAAGNQWRILSDAIDISRGERARHPARIGARGKDVILDLAASAMIVIDMQDRFCQLRPGETAAPTAGPIAPLRRLLPHLRASHVPVIWLNWGNRPDKLNLAPGVIHPFHRQGGAIPPILDKGGGDAKIIEGLSPEPSDILIDKYRISGFWDTELDSVLRNLRVQTLLFAGVNLDQCVYATIIDAHCLGYDCVLVEDCAATRSPRFCTEATLYNVEHGLGFVTNAAALHAARAV